MGLYLNTQDKFTRLNEIRFDTERAIQSLTRKNLEEIFNVELVKNEFPIGDDDRADILAYDKKRRRFVIIEFKKDKKRGILEQLRNYLNLAKKNPDSLCQEYGRKLGKHFDSRKVDWGKMIGIAIAPSFDKYQINDAAGDDRIVLCEIHRYENDIFEFKQLGNPENRIEKSDFPMPIRSKTIDLEFHLSKCNTNTRQIYDELERQIMKINNNIEILIKKIYISFRINDKAFVRIYTQKNKLLIYMRIKSGEMHISKRSTLVIKKGMRNYVGGDSEIAISKKSDIIHLMTLIKQSYERSVVIVPIMNRLSTNSREYDILSECNASTRSLYDEIKSRILELGNNIDVYGTKYRIIFKTKRNFVSFRMSKIKMRVYLPIPRNEFQRMQDGNLDAIHSSGEVRVMISSRSEILPLMRLVEYSYNQHADNGATRIYQDKS